MAFLASDVVVRCLRQFQVETRVVGRLGGLVLLLGGVHVGLGGFQQRVVVDHFLARLGQVAGQQRLHC
ncbi:hypothetical protein D3C78_1542050 [compost metagenome]